MRKFLKKIICVATAGLMTAGLFAVTACDGVYKSDALKGDISGEVTSNGGFAVKKGGYIYYINGKQSNTADNTFGKVETGAIMRISENDLKARNYANAETVVPEIVHSGNNNGGLFIYGDYVYYSTPSTEKNSDGEIQNSTVHFKRAKLDGTEVMKGYYAKYNDNTIEYRFVEGEDKVVYLLYVAKSEDLYGTAYTNLHSVNTQTGTDTVLAYNVDSVMFDSKNIENPRVYYTMSVTDFKLSTTAVTSYNQIYTVTANETTPKEYDFSEVKDYDAEKDPLYINCGKLVYDGIGKLDGDLSLTQFNADELNDADTLASLNRPSYKYTLSNYENGTLFYTRPISSTDTTPVLFAEKEEELLSDSHRPATGARKNEDSLTSNASNASSYRYIFDENGNVSGAFISDSNGLIKTSVDKNGKLVTDVNKMDENGNIFYIDRSGAPTILFIEGDDIYYSVSGNGNGLCIKRVNYSGTYDKYYKMSESDEAIDYSFRPVQILDLDCSSANDWYLPEMFDGRILFSTLNTTMTEYNTENSDYTHIMVCDINGDGAVMSNKDIKELNEKYEKIEETIGEVDESIYKNIKDAYRYVFYTGDTDRIDDIIEAYVADGEDEDDYWSKDTLAKVRDFAIADGDWAEFNDKKTVNGKDVFANQRDYYYSLLGKMTKENAETYADYLSDTYLRIMPEEELSWFEGLSGGAKAGFLIGVIGGGLILIGAGVVVAIIIIRKRKEKLPAYTKTRIKVDTTDDKSVDVYSTDDAETAEATETTDTENIEE